MCRLRDLTYAAPIYVDVIYWKGDRKIRIWASLLISVASHSSIALRYVKHDACRLHQQHFRVLTLIALQSYELSGKRDVEIGLLPVMLRSNLCALSGKSEEVPLSQAVVANNKFKWTQQECRLNVCVCVCVIKHGSTVSERGECQCLSPIH